jgi:hypothetical protein
MGKHRTIYTLTALTLILITSCLGKKPSVHNTWFYAHNATAENSRQNPVKLTPENFIDLQPDGNYSSYISRFEFGTWERDGKQIQIKNHKGEKKVFTIISHKDGELTLDLTPDVGDDYYRVFTGVSNEKSQGDNNPFGKENNYWRIRSSTPETSEQIKDRLVNHFRYWEKYFEWAIANNLQSLDIRNPNSPLKLYGNGFQLIPYEELSDEWKSNFFNEENSREAWDKLKKLIDTKDIAWAKTDNRFTMFLSTFQQLQGMVE